jgi:hypothetical protein
MRRLRSIPTWREWKDGLLRASAETGNPEQRKQGNSGLAKA